MSRSNQRATTGINGRNTSANTTLNAVCAFAINCVSCKLSGRSHRTTAGNSGMQTAAPTTLNNRLPTAIRRVSVRAKPEIGRAHV